MYVALDEYLAGDVAATTIITKAIDVYGKTKPEIRRWHIDGDSLGSHRADDRSRT